MNILGEVYINVSVIGLVCKLDIMPITRFCLLPFSLFFALDDFVPIKTEVN